ncbi:hypothetical protein ALC57_18290 [Trachymyrmex cornetzi]|uniref:Mos1 transposase HTH domain-containing protein n=1 Tax=Trachymyrmex cornetzi TaxID=471704 RepID=A0A151IS84_9HYME|nr:hypothetical protein ALC57_18290 [Trachymyrmex cornetzi]
MEKEQYRSVIRFLFLDRKMCEEIKTKLDAVYGNSSLSMTTARYGLFAEFDKSYFTEGLKKWQKRWEKCILLKGD